MLLNYRIIILFLSLVLVFGCSQKPIQVFSNIELADVETFTSSVNFEKGYPECFGSSDSLVALQYKDHVEVHNFYNKTSEDYSVQKLSWHNDYLGFSVVNNQTLIVSDDFKKNKDNHAFLFFLYDLQRKKRIYYNFKGAPVQYSDMDSLKWVNRNLKDKRCLYEINNGPYWKHQFNSADSSTYVGLILYSTTEEKSKHTKLPKMLIAKVSISKRTMVFSAMTPNWKYTETGCFAYDIFGPNNCWVDDTTMIYGFGSMNNVYCFNSRTNKVVEVPANYKLFPHVVKNADTGEFSLWKSNSHYEKFLKNLHTNNYFRLASTTSKRFILDKSQGNGIRNYILFWHKSPKEIYETIMPDSVISIDFARKDTLYCAVMSSNKTIAFRKYVVKPGKEISVEAYWKSRNEIPFKE